MVTRQSPKLSERVGRIQHLCTPRGIQHGGEFRRELQGPAAKNPAIDVVGMARHEVCGQGKNLGGVGAQRIINALKLLRD